MDEFVILWIAVALIVFWAVGAYNRLVRLRSQTVQAFAAVNEQLSKYVALARVTRQL